MPWNAEVIVTWFKTWYLLTFRTFWIPEIQCNSNDIALINHWIWNKLLWWLKLRTKYTKFVGTIQISNRYSINHNDRIKCHLENLLKFLVFNLILSHSKISKSNFEVLGFAFRYIPIFEHDRVMNHNIFNILITINSYT